MGLQRESAVSLLREAGAATPAVVQDAEVLAASASAKGYGGHGLQGGAASPFARWVRGERSLPAAMQRRSVAISRGGLDARMRLTASLGKNPPMWMRALGMP